MPSRTVRIALVGALALTAAVTPVLAGSAQAAPAAVDTGTVRVYAGSTVTDSGLYDGVFKAGLATGFEAAYPQYHLQFTSIGTNAVLTQAELGNVDVAFTHSDQLEEPFVQAGYSYEPGGRLIMTSDFDTVGPAADPAGVGTGPAEDVVTAFKEIAAAGNAGKAEFISRNDKSGTNIKELQIWKLTGIPTDAAGHPVQADGKTPPAWYQETNLTQQGQNLMVTDQCKNYAANACYTLVDRGTYNTLTGSGVVTNLKVLNSLNSAPTALGGPSLLINPYHAYAVNPAKEPSVNLPGALAFLNYLTSPATQTAIGNFPTAANPNFTPDAVPDATVNPLPTNYVAGTPLTLSGTLTPHAKLDPPLTGATIDIVRTADPSTTLATTQVAADGTWKAAFRANVSGPYSVVVPQSLDHLVGTTSFRQPTTISAGTLSAKGSTTLSLATRQRVFSLKSGSTVVPVFGTVTPQLDRQHATVRIQIRKGTGAWVFASKPIALRANTGRYSTKVVLRRTGTWQIRSVYEDLGVVSTADSRTFYVHVV